MIVELGAFALALSLMLSVMQAGLSTAGRARRSPVLAGAGEGAALAAFLAVAVAFAALAVRDGGRAGVRARVALLLAELEHARAPETLFGGRSTGFG